MNKYNSESYKDQFTPAFKASIGDLCIFMDHIELNVQPNLNTMCETDSYVLTDKEEFSLMVKRLFKKK